MARNYNEMLFVLLGLNTLKAESNPICPLLALFWAYHILHISM